MPKNSEAISVILVFLSRVMRGQEQEQEQEHVGLVPSFENSLQPRGFVTSNKHETACW